MSKDLAQKTWSDYVTEYGSMDRAFWAAISGSMGFEESSIFEQRFFTEHRCYAAVVEHLHEKYPTLLEAMQLYKIGSLSADEMRAIEKYVLPRGAYHIFL